MRSNQEGGPKERSDDPESTSDEEDNSQDGDGDEDDMESKDGEVGPEDKSDKVDKISNLKEVKGGERENRRARYKTEQYDLLLREVEGYHDDRDVEDIKLGPLLIEASHLGDEKSLEEKFDEETEAEVGVEDGTT